MNATPLSSFDDSSAYEFPSLRVLKEAHLTLLQCETKQVDALEGDGDANPHPAFLEDVLTFMLRARATGRVLEDEKERAAAQTLLNYWATVLFRANVPDVPKATLLDVDESAGRDLDESQCPYLGLDEFSEDKAHLFFGRKQLVSKWMSSLQEHQLLVILGPSGSGKTSLVKAGLLPTLKSGIEIPGSSTWHYRECSLPDENLLATLAKLNASIPALLVLHRFEDLFTRCGDDKRKAILDALLTWMQQPGAEHRIIGNARSEAATGITQWVERDLKRLATIAFVPPLSARDLRAVIETPAEQIGLRFDEGLVDSLVDELSGEPASLAILQFVLLQLWKERRRNRITWAAYHALGGAQRAVAKVAEDICRSLNAEDLTSVKELFLRLVRPSLLSREFVTCRLPISELARPEKQHRTLELAEQFEKADLLRVRKGAEKNVEVFIEVTHEALLRRWPRLVYEWLEETRDLLRQRQRIGIAAMQWRAQGKDPAALWSGGLLREALGIRGKLSPEEREFVDASRRNEAIRKWAKRIIVTAVILSLAAWLWSAVASSKALENKRVELATRLAQMHQERAMRALEAGDPAGAFLWFTEALREDPNKANESLHRLQLGATWRQMPRLKELFHDPESNRAALAPGGQFAATGGRSGVRLWQLRSGSAPLSRQLETGRRINWVAFHPHPETPLLLAAGHAANDPAKGEVRVWDAATGRMLGTPLLLSDGPAQKAWFSPYGDRLVAVGEAAGGRGGLVSVWNFRTGVTEAEPLRQLQHTLPVNWAAFSPDGQTIVTAAGVPHDGTEGQARVWAWRPQKVIELQRENSPLQYAEFNDEGTQIVTASGALEEALGTARVWSYTPGDEKAPAQSSAITAPFTHGGSVVRARFSPDGRWLATASFDRTVRLWHVRTQKEVLNLKHGGDVYDIAFSPDGRHLVSGSRDRQARIWELATGRLVQPPLHHSETVNEVAFSEDGRSILATSRHTTRLWQSAPDEPKVVRLEHTVAEAAPSGDGRRVATVSSWSAPKGRSVEVREATAGEPIASIKVPHQGRVLVALNADGSHLAITCPPPPEGGTFTARVYRIAIGQSHPKQLCEIALPDEPGLITLSADGSRLCSVSRDRRRISLWHAETGQQTGASLGPQDLPITQIQISPKGTYLLALCGDLGARRGEARLWVTSAMPPGAVSLVLTHEERVTTADFSADERHILTGGIDDNVHLWEVTGDQILNRGILLSKSAATTSDATKQHTHTADLTCVRFSPDGRRAITASKDQTAILWDIFARAPIAVLRHSAVVENAVFSTDGRLALTSTREPKLRIWNATDGGLISILNAPGEFLDDGIGAEAGGIFAISESLGARAAAPATSSSTARKRGGDPQPASLRIALLNWSLEPFSIELERIARLGKLVGTRELLNGEFVPALKDTVSGIWEAERTNYAAMFRKEEDPLLFHSTAADVCEATQQWFAATWHLSKILTLRDKNKSGTDLLLRRAGDYRSAEEWPGALRRSIADLNTVIDRGKGSAKVYERLGQTYATQAVETGDDRQWNRAIEAFQKAADLEPKSPKRLNDLGEVYGAVRKYEQAQAIFARAFDLDKKDARSRARLALIHLLRRDEARYVELCSVLRSKDLPRGIEGLIWTAVLTPAFEGDRKFCDRMVELQRSRVDDEPDNYHQRNTLGAVLYRAGRFSEALTELEASRAALVAKRATAVAQSYDHLIRAPISLNSGGRSTETADADGRPVDWVFLAMTHARLGNAGKADRWMDKVRETRELAHFQHPDARKDRPVPWSVLSLELLFEEASALTTSIVAPNPAR